MADKLADLLRETREAKARSEELLSQVRADSARKAGDKDKLRQHQLREEQADVDTLFAIHGLSAPPARADSSVNGYRRALAPMLARYLPDGHTLRALEWSDIPSDALPIFYSQLKAAVQESAFRPDSVPPGKMEKRIRRDQSGREVTEWIGQDSFVKDFAPPVTRRAKIRDLADFARSRAFD